MILIINKCILLIYFECTFSTVCSKYTHFKSPGVSGCLLYFGNNLFTSKSVVSVSYRLLVSYIARVPVFA